MRNIFDLEVSSEGGCWENNGLKFTEVNFKRNGGIMGIYRDSFTTKLFLSGTPV